MPLKRRGRPKKVSVEAVESEPRPKRRRTKGNTVVNLDLEKALGVLNERARAEPHALASEASQTRHGMSSVTSRVSQGLESESRVDFSRHKPLEADADGNDSDAASDELNVEGVPQLNPYDVPVSDPESLPSVHSAVASFNRSSV